MNRKFQILLAVIISVLPIIYTAIIWQSLPDSVPIHYDGAFKPNGFATRQSFILTNCFLAGISLLVYALMLNIRKIDPKRAEKISSPVFEILGFGIVIFMTAINFITIISAVGKGNLIAHALNPLIGLLFVFLGLLMPRIQPNYFAGLRLPWTLHSDYNWRKTHALSGKIWTICGIAITVVALLLPLPYQKYLLPVSLPVLVGVPIVYSFMLYRKEQADPGIAGRDSE
jgi:uncharacterized membrane protein